jgi:non-lysosomal glucosylceramidase
MDGEKKFSMGGQPDWRHHAFGPPRREFLKKLGLGVAALSVRRWSVASAGPPLREDFEHFVPADKGLSPEWIRSLFARGEPQVYHGSELDKIGMPVGGICAGQLYLGGDGRLWHWDIFNVGWGAGPPELHYRVPMTPSSPLEQGFAVRIKSGGKIEERKLQGGAWDKISFRGEYPIGRVEYADAASPLSVTLEAYSPFIPLNVDDSSLPATILEFTLKNSGAEKIEVDLCGWLENGVGLESAKKHAGQRRNQISRQKNLLRLECDAVEAVPGDKPFSREPDFGTLTLALLDPGKANFANPSVSLENVFDVGAGTDSTSAPLTEKLIGALGRKIELKPGASAEVTFVLAWRFPNLTLDKLGPVGCYYATRFDSAWAVADYVAKNHLRLAGQTRLWRDTWYDSTLPYWFLDRTFLNTSILASSTYHHFANGRFYGWEGVRCCPGTCCHVYHYAQAIARLFPELERGTRERVDFGIALQPDGAIFFRAEFNDFPAVDGQAGTILRALREHQMSADSEFLKRNWPAIKRATGWLIAKDANDDGLIESNQHNTLDSDWFGPVAWLSGLYLAALSAAAEMADEVGDAEFAARCRAILETGRRNLVAQLFDGEYFIARVDPKHLDAINSGTGCEIDQVLGQSWAFQVGLPRVLPQKETVSALKSLWRYNFSPDVGPYRAIYKSGRWYAMAGESGLLMCSFPRRDWDYAQARGKGPEGVAGYFNECMNGFEHQAAGHMIWEGMVMEGLAVERAVHERYSASRRNPWNEVECGDHYARSMASYGVFLAACGFEYHGPRQHIGFAPKLSPDNFKCAFTSAEGWGALSQSVQGGKQKAEIAVRWGRLKLKTIALENAGGNSVSVLHAGKSLPATLARDDKRALITLAQPLDITAGQALGIIIS